MVAPYEVGEPVRSFVRVPTKGRVARTISWDISRSSYLAAALAPLQDPWLPRPVAPRDPAGHTSSPREELAATPGPPPPGSQQPQPQAPPRQAPPSPSEPKRPREEEEEQESTRPPVLKVARTAGSPGAGPSSPTQPQQGLEEEVHSLRQQCQSLQQQNEDLQRRLGLFHGLFKDKQRLQGFVRHLNTLVK
ncbi:hypothetical protein GWK47_012271 [Chionoecetes opilio]|uniref:Uncharacterized protein n=1 Tax=Chionoecetes opilio TaxID=41210 RepID=A0A8J4XXF3_CHIOP|nr:hypothetical protein GWK47_012271 [Chionoecetes opilio]